jgi:hypothetical protein
MLWTMDAKHQQRIQKLKEEQSIRLQTMTEEDQIENLNNSLFIDMEAQSVLP